MSVNQVLDIELNHIRHCALQQMTANASVAHSYGLKLIAYEGGQSLAGIGEAESNSALTALFVAANRHPRMGDLYAEYLQNWKAVGGDLFMHFSDVGSYGKYGTGGRWNTRIRIRLQHQSFRR